MSIHALLFGLVLAGQISSANDRYPPPGSGQRPTDGGTNRVSSPPAGTIPLFDSQPKSDIAGQNQSPPTAGGTEPYRPTNQQSPPSQPGYPSTTADSTKAVKPSTMMANVLTPPRDSRLAGEPITLIDVVNSAASRLEQSQRVEAYWDLCSSVADYYLGLREQEELRQLKSQVRTTGTVWQQAETELALRLDTSLKAARVSQRRLADLSGRGLSRLPLPANPPHCGSYNCRYQEIFAGRPSPEAQELSELLPLRYAELKDASAAVPRAEELLQRVVREDSDGTGTLRALEFLALRRRAFVQLARDYNRRIARYAELASPGEIGADRLIGILIKIDNASTATRGSSPAPPPNRQSSIDTAAPPATFTDANDWEPAGNRTLGAARDDAVQPASVDSPLHERSLLIRAD